MASMHHTQARSAVQHASGRLMVAHQAADDRYDVPVSEYPPGSASWHDDVRCAHCRATTERCRLGADVLVLVTHQLGCQELAAARALQESAPCP